MERVWTDRLDLSEMRPKAEVAMGYTRFAEGDVLLPKITPTFEAGRAAIACGLDGGVGAGTTELHVLRPLPHVDRRWLMHFLNNATFLRRGHSDMYGVAGQKRISDEFVKSYPVNLPRFEDQRSVADSLDAETARVDELIAEQLGTRRFLDERVWSFFIDRLLALQPAEVPLRRLLRRLSDGPFGSAFTSSDYCDEGAAVVRLGNIGFAEYRATDQAFIPLDLYAQFLRHEVQAGDLLIAGLGDTRNHAGRACVSPDLGPAIVKGKCFVA